MSRRDDVLTALRHAYGEGAGLDGLTAEQLLDAYRAQVLTELADKAERRLSVGRSNTVTKATVLRFLRLEASCARAAVPPRTDARKDTDG